MLDLNHAKQFAPFIPYIAKGPSDAAIILGPRMEPKRSIEIFNDYLKDDPFAGDVLKSLLGAYLRNGDYDKASETYGRLIKISPRSAAVAGPQGQPQGRTGDTNK